jgi:hypothetical protein
MVSLMPAPDLIIISKPDLYDGRGALKDYLSQGGYEKSATLPAFTIWARKKQAPGANKP